MTSAFDFGAFPPEVNSAKMYAGPGSASMRSARPGSLAGRRTDSGGQGCREGGVQVAVFALHTGHRPGAGSGCTMGGWGFLRAR